MTDCIYCGNLLAPGAVDGSQPSLEHIIQVALGGSDQVATRDACSNCNSTLGDTVDADFINEPVVGMIRLTYGTAGNSGKVPDVRLKGRSVDTNEPADVAFGAARVDISQRPVVIRQPDDQGGEQVLVAGSPAEAQKIAAGILAAARSRGMKVQDSAGRPISNVTDLLASAHIESSGEFRIPVPFNESALHSGLIKIAYGFGHLILGSQWSSAAARLRSIATGCGTPKLIRDSIMGMNVGVFATMFGMPTTSRDHLLAVIPLGTPMIIVSLFGEAALTVAVPIERADLLEDLVLHDSRIAVRVNPNARTAQWITAHDFLRHSGQDAIADALKRAADER